MLDVVLPQDFYIIKKHVDWPRIKGPGSKNFELPNKKKTYVSEQA